MADESSNPNVQQVGMIFQYPISEQIALAVTEDGYLIITNDGPPHPRAMILGNVQLDLGSLSEGLNWTINGIKANDKRN